MTLMKATEDLDVGFAQVGTMIEKSVLPVRFICSFHQRHVPLKSFEFR